MDERTLGVVLGLLASAETNIQTVRKLIVGTEQQPAQEGCSHPRTKVLSVLGGDDIATRFCLDCGLRLDE